jgi:hypothetical protein
MHTNEHGATIGPGIGAFGMENQVCDEAGLSYISICQARLEHAAAVFGKSPLGCATSASIIWVFSRIQTMRPARGDAGDGPMKCGG